MKNSTPARAFTLTELLVVMAVISILSVVTVVSMRALGRDARLSSGVNSLTASLDNCRALAIKLNRVVLLVCRPRLETDRKMVVDLVPCQWTGESYLNTSASGGPNVVDRFVEIPDAPVRTLPAGIKIAAPWYGDDDVSGEARDGTWTTQAHLPLTRNGQEVPGSLIAVMYGPDGTTLSGNSQSNSDLVWADLARRDTEFDPGILDPPTMEYTGAYNDPVTAPYTFNQYQPTDEPFLRIAPFISVYDDDEARERSGQDLAVPGWADTAQGLQKYQAELTGPTGYISISARRIHFNVYTGVAMK